MTQLIPKCSVADCDSLHNAKGYCRSHYNRMRRHGSPFAGKPSTSTDVNACSVEGCDGKYEAKGLCQKHYCRMKKTGSLFEVQTHKELTPDTFWVRVAVTANPDRCWEWQRSRDKKGYGVVGRNNKTIKAHRYALSLTTGEMPDHLSALHTCDNPPCCNPSHLWWGTLGDNNADMKAKGRYRFGETHHRAILTEDQVRRIREDVRSNREIAQDYGVSRGAINSVRNGDNWSHVT